MKLLSNQVSEQEVAVIVRELKLVLTNKIIGDVVEFGCYVGTTSVYMQQLLQGTNRELHVYDSFKGLPEKVAEDVSPAGSQFVAGELNATKNLLIKNFKQAGLELPYIHKQWFSEVTKDDVPEQIAFAFLDGDFYHSILDSLKVIWPRLSPGAIIVIDDFYNEQLPGVQKAVSTWSQHHRFILKIEASLAIIYV